jgi:hypothetical protein
LKNGNEKEKDRQEKADEEVKQEKEKIIFFQSFFIPSLLFL